MQKLVNWWVKTVKAINAIYLMRLKMVIIQNGHFLFRLCQNRMQRKYHTIHST